MIDDLAPLTATDARVAGGYQLLGRLGTGELGPLFLGRATTAGTLAAVRTPPSVFAAAPVLQRAVVVARGVPAWAAAVVLAFMPDAHPPVLAREYVEGRTLREVVGRQGPLPGHALDGFALATLRALAGIHAAGATHGGLGPGEVVLGASGPRITDVGLARAARLIVGFPLRNPAFHAPEELVDLTVETPAADVFRWGGLVLFAATGRPPFGAEASGLAQLRAIRHDEPRLDRLGDALRPAVSAAMAKDPAARPSATDIADGLPAGPNPGPRP
jgi:hypothetical protein